MLLFPFYPAFASYLVGRWISDARQWRCVQCDPIIPSKQIHRFASSSVFPKILTELALGW
jgi:hypothetical protein